MNGLVNGKQIKNSTLGLVKLDISGSQGSYIFATGSSLGTYDLPTTPQAYANKQYVDSVAAGLDPKASVYVVSVANVTASGLINIDGITVSNGSRVLLAGQTSAVNNGIYVASATGSWIRASDSDGSVVGDVSLGNYTFVEQGGTYSGTGWVLYKTNDTTGTGATVSVGVDTQLWTLFSGAGTFMWSNGLQAVGSVVSINLDPTAGLTFSGSGQLKVASYLAGSGLGFSSGVISVGQGSGITVNPTNISVNYTTVSNALSGAGLSASSNVLNILLAKGVTFSGNYLYADAGTILTTANLPNSGIATSSTIQSALLALDSSLGTSTIAGKIKGNGLTAYNGLLSITSSNAGLTVSTNAIALQLGSSNDGSLSIQSDGLDLNRATLGSNLAGTGLTSNAGSISINTSNGITIIGNSVQLNQTVAGSGLTFSSGAINHLLAKGVTFSGNYLFADASTILTTVNLPNSGIATSSTIQSALTSIDTLLSNTNIVSKIKGNGLTAYNGLLSITSSNAGLTVSSNAISLQLGSSNDGSLSIQSDGLSLNRLTLGSNLAGNGLTSSAGSISVNTSNGIIITSNSVQLNQTVAGNGLTFSSGIINILSSKGVTFSNDYLFADASTILTTANLPNTGVGTNSTIQSALSSIDTALANVAAQQMVSFDNNPTGTFLNSVNAPKNILSYTFSVKSDGYPHIYINGVYVNSVGTTSSSPAYFSIDGGVTGTTSVLANSVLFMNPFVLGFNLDPTDDIIVNYLTKFP